jgi:PHD/YefM family antitoxin component YafN of YafNO toxin-antitoxin module
MTVTEARAQLQQIKDAVQSAEEMLATLEQLPPEAAAAFTTAMLKIATAMSGQPM